MELEQIRGPEDLKTLGAIELEALAQEIRTRIIQVCLKNGGHIGASLGTVELTLALHRIFDSPRDAMIWDVGHQAYAHKILTGRNASFETLRTTNGISGFLSREESPHDVYGAGHSSTSISAATGFAYKNENWTIAIIGDGALTAGVAFEALNHLVEMPERGRTIIVLNDNQHSISENVGGIHRLLTQGNASVLFHALGYDYLGPFDGHNIEQLVGILNAVKTAEQDRPLVLHVMTQKGRGYFPAERAPVSFHGISPPKKSADKTEPKPAQPGKTFSEQMGALLEKHAPSDERILAITAAMSEGTGLAPFFEKFPNRAFDVGIAEPHAVTFSAGLACRGWKPVVCIYSTFLQRGIDPIIHDVALQKLPVVFAVDRAGLVGADGPTHHGAYDLSYFSMVPGVEIWAPTDATEMAFAFERSLQSQDPFAIRYPRGACPEQGRVPSSDQLGDGFRVYGSELSQAKRILIVVGAIGSRFQAWAESQPGMSLIQLLQVKPLTQGFKTALTQAATDASIFLLIEGATQGNALPHELESVVHRTISVRGIPDEFIEQGSPAELEKKLGWDLDSVRSWVSG